MQSLPAAIDGPMMFACLISSLSSHAQLVASGVLTCGPISIGTDLGRRAWAIKQGSPVGYGTKR
jgi:hypothetical protein